MEVIRVKPQSIEKIQYYNGLELGQTVALFKSDPYEAINRMEKYIEKYPSDYYSYSFYINMLLSLRKFDEAEVMLDNVSKLVDANSHYKHNVKMYEAYRRGYNFCQMKLLLHKGKYCEVYDSYIKPYMGIYSLDNYDLDKLFDNQHLADRVNMRQIKFYCMKKLGLTDLNRKDDKPYLIRQIIDYDYNDFLKHAYRHMIDFNSDNEEEVESLFVSGFPLERVLEEVRKYIPSEKGIYTGVIADRYTFKYTKCGRSNNKLTDYFQIPCFHDTDQFITLYPLIDGKYLDYVDLDYMNEINEKSDSKVKRLSQIDKFNQRFTNR